MASRFSVINFPNKKYYVGLHTERISTADSSKPRLHKHPIRTNGGVPSGLVKGGPSSERRMGLIELQYQDRAHHNRGHLGREGRIAPIFDLTKRQCEIRKLKGVSCSLAPPSSSRHVIFPCSQARAHVSDGYPACVAGTRVRALVAHLWPGAARMSFDHRLVR